MVNLWSRKKKMLKIKKGRKNSKRRELHITISLK
jgi:hypothetical protein